jgi:serine protease Do
VIADSPAARAGIRPEDLVVAVGGEPVLGVNDLIRLLTGDRIDQRVELSVFRGGTPRSVELVPAELSAR